jgi:hypothetical protein
MDFSLDKYIQIVPCTFCHSFGQSLKWLILGRENQMNANQNVVEQAEKDYDEASKFFYSKLPHKEEFLFTGEEIDDFAWSVASAINDAIEAGMDRSEVLLRAVAFALRHFAKHGSSAYYESPDSAWGELLASARAARPGVVVPFPLKPEGAS